MKTKQKKQSLFDVRRRNQRERTRKRNRGKLREILLRIASSKPTSPFHMAMKMAAMEAIGFEIARFCARLVPVINRVVLNENKA